jgi:hypothetical protein
MSAASKAKEAIHAALYVLDPERIWFMLRKKPKDPQLSLLTDVGFAWW